MSLLFTQLTVTNKSLIVGRSFLSGFIPAKANRSFNGNGLEIGGIRFKTFAKFRLAPKMTIFYY